MRIFAILVLILIFAAFACGCAETAKEGAEEIVEEVSELADSGYENVFRSPDGNFAMHWRSDSEKIYIKMTGDSDGWVAVGFNPSSAMKDADIILGFYGGGKAEIHDMFSTGLYGPHPDDTEQGGTYDISEFTVSESEGKTTVEFSRSLDTGDDYDSVLTKGENVQFIWAISDRDDSDFKHNIAKGKGSIVV